MSLVCMRNDSSVGKPCEHPHIVARQFARTGNSRDQRSIASAATGSRPRPSSKAETFIIDGGGGGDNCDICDNTKSSNHDHGWLPFYASSSVIRGVVDDLSWWFVDTVVLPFKSRSKQLPAMPTTNRSSNGTRIDQSRNEKSQQHHQRPTGTREANENQVQDKAIYSE